MGMASKVISIFLRGWAFISAVIVTGISGSFIHHLHTHDLGSFARINYTISIAVISIVFSLVLMPPFRYTFWAFPFDAAMFIMWMVAFGLLAGVSSYMASISMF